MSASVEKSLDLLVQGLRGYIARQIPPAVFETLRRPPGAVDTWDAHSTLAFMWDHWNDVFRHSLGFTERSLISELRVIRNRWAHQESFSTRDVYRTMDNVERLLEAVDGKQIFAIRRMRIETMKTLMREECGAARGADWRYQVWPYLLCGTSALGLGIAVILFFNASPGAWFLAGMIFIAMMRIAWLQTVRESLHRFGPHECSDCGCIIYTENCPYCAPGSWSRDEFPGGSVTEVHPRLARHQAVRQTS